MARDAALADGTLLPIPEDIKPKDLMESYWFIDHEANVIIEVPNNGDPNARESAYFYPITSKIQSRKGSDKKRVREALVFGKLHLERNYFNYWPSNDRFIMHEEISNAWDANAKKSLTILKSKVVMLLHFLFS